MRREKWYVIGEVELLRGTDTVDNIAARIGYSNRYSLARSLSRWGRGDLAELFGKKLVSTSGGSGEESYL